MLVSTLSIAFSFLIAGIFFASGSSKLRRENHFYYQQTIENYDIVPTAWSGPLVSIIACYEITVALLTFIPTYQKLGLIMAAAILSIYCYSFIKQLAQGKMAVSCGCAGPSSDLTISTGLVLRNMALVTLCLIISFMSWPELKISWSVVVPTTMVIGLVYLSIDQLLINDQKIQALRLSKL